MNKTQLLWNNVFHISLSAKNTLDPARNENWHKKWYMTFLHESPQLITYKVWLKSTRFICTAILYSALNNTVLHWKYCIDQKRLLVRIAMILFQRIQSSSVMWSLKMVYLQERTDRVQVIDFSRQCHRAT